MGRFPQVVYKEEVMRDGLQIEDASISVDDRLRLVDALGETGLKHMRIANFASPRWCPQMACIDEFLRRFKPKPGVTYDASIHNLKGLERAKQYSPPLTLMDTAWSGEALLRCHMSDVFPRRNINVSQEQLIARWPGVVARAREQGVKEAGIMLASAFGCNFVGEFTLEERMQMLERMHRLWNEVGIQVTRVALYDEMGWNMPHEVEATLLAIKKRWPEVKRFKLHLHNARGTALASIYAALRVLEPTDTLLIDGTLGGIGGCPYCGDGRATGMVPTEDLMHMLEAMGIETGVDLDKLIECVWILEEILGRRSFGHVGNAGPRPVTPDKWYPMDLPFIETLEQARHFKLGPKVYAGCIFPWKEPVQSPQRLERERLWGK